MKPNELAIKALKAFTATVEATGGIRPTRKGTHVCAADQDWLDLADAYVLACDALGELPMIIREKTSKESLCLA